MYTVLKYPMALYWMPVFKRHDSVKTLCKADQ